MSIGADLLRSSERKISAKKNLTLQGNGVTRGMTPDKIQAIVADYKNGSTLNQLAAKYHRRNTTIRAILTENGVRILAMGEGWRKHTLNETYFDKIDTPEKAYILGFIAADGCVYLNPKRPGQGAFMLHLQKRDVEMLHFVKRAIGSSHPLHYQPHVGNGANLLIISNRRFCDGLIRAGITPRKSLTLQFPSVSVLPKELRRFYILGYFDGDGSVSHNDQKGFWTFSMLGTRHFLEAVLQELHDFIPNLKPQQLQRHWKTPDLFNISWAGRHFGSYVKNRAIWHIYRYLYEGHEMGLRRKRVKVEHIAPHYAP